MTGISRRYFLAASAATGAYLVHPFKAEAAAGQIHLRLIETTDIHVAIDPYDYYGDKPDDTQGLARTATLIESLRDEAENTLLLDNGDLLQGNPLGDYIAHRKGVGDDVHPMIKAMNILGYDCATLGNHEFNYGLEFLQASLADAAFPFVCANVVVGPELGQIPTQDETLFPPYYVMDRGLVDGAGEVHEVKIGVIGFVPPQILQWDEANLKGRVSVRDIVAAARAWVPKLRQDEGCDLVIALAHTGIEGGGYTAGMENAALYVAEIEGIDVVLTGHQHRVLPGPDYEGIEGVDAQKGTLAGKPAVMAGFWGSHMGLIDLMLEKQGDKWQIVSHTSEARPIYKREDRKAVALVGSLPIILDAVEADHEATLAYIRAPVGKTSAPLYSYFAQVADDPSVQIVSQAQSWYAADMLKETAYKDLPILSAAAPFKCGGRGGPDYYTNVPEGPVAIKNVADLYLYPNTFRALKVTGATVADWLERSAGAFNQITAGAQDAALLNPDFPSYNFDVMDGVTYRVDLSKPSKFDSDGKQISEGGRIIDLMFNGKPIDPEQEFIVASNNYRAGGGGNFPGIEPSKIIFEGPDTNRDILLRFIQKEGTINPSADRNWGFAPMADTTVTFASGPAGRAFMEAVKGVQIADAGEAEGGFALYRITL
ncbi:bifunctional 2',3'-cyclic-nucleotide 2'-phosphodiesterase/3'-nucleotidase [Thioclava litoralis]|uniref:Bifunctional 2',3'-cyclic-nucleotide 2'-phosphodiesterase/3'-nucleotidase n=1 Tax=Thioclava litoralis TaxID=3076557 RepID=A0ABZ1DWE9_9RHOB|nr:bifunctional 2',3'-cyclic-nucleotide 2'-phosphodiesterase/3'-nucleotidase [Thioclava sp. FTW29]